MVGRIKDPAGSEFDRRTRRATAIFGTVRGNWFQGVGSGNGRSFHSSDVLGYKVHYLSVHSLVLIQPLPPCVSRVPNFDGPNYGRKASVC